MSAVQGFSAFLALDLHLAAAFRIDADRLYGRRCQHRSAQFAECALHGLRHLFVLQRHHAGHVLHDGDFDPQRRIEPSELAADGARTHDDHRFGQFRKRQGLTRRDDALAVNGHERHFARARPRGQNDVVGFVLRAVHVEFSGGREPSESRYEVDVVLAQQEGHAFAHGLGHAARAGHDFFQIGLHFAREVESVMCGRFAVGVNLRAFQQRLGRDAAPVEAHAPGFGPLHERYFAAQLRSAYGGDVAARSASHDDNIVFHNSVECLLSVTVPLSVRSVGTGFAGRGFAALFYDPEDFSVVLRHGALPFLVVTGELDLVGNVPAVAVGPRSAPVRRRRRGRSARRLSRS